jgi:hypothetical protein
MMKIELLLSAMTAIGTFLTGIVAIIKIPKIAKRVLFKNETLFGREAEDRYRRLKNSTPAGLVFEPREYRGGNKHTPQFEIERVIYDAQTMPSEWKGYTKSVRYYDQDEITGKIMEHCWRLK